MPQYGQDTLNTKRTLTLGETEYSYFSLKALAQKSGADITRLPFSLKVLLENLLRWENGKDVHVSDIDQLEKWLDQASSDCEIAFRPARVLMQDFTGVPAVVDLAAMRDAAAERGDNPAAINPICPVDLVIDHSIMVDDYGHAQSLKINETLEFKRNRERYEFLRWGQQAFENFRVVPPGTGICHQVNLEYLAQVVMTQDQGELLAFPDTLVGTDSHTTMINALGVLGWGVGGIEAEAAMLGQPVSMVLPDVVGFKLSGRLREGTTATDLVLRVVQMLRERGVVGKFVEFYGPALDHLPLPDRATIANMAPEYGATCGFFPIDGETIRYLSFTSRQPDQVKLVEAYAKEQGLWRESAGPDPIYSDTLELDLATVEPSLAGPKRPQDRIELSGVAASFDQTLQELASQDKPRSVKVQGQSYSLHDGDVVIAAITSCTNTSNPSVMLGAGLLAKKALEKGLKVKPWVKTSLAPGSQVVTDYLKAAGLQEALDELGFTLAGYGCTTCIGNSGPLAAPIGNAVQEGDLVVASVLSGNRNFEGRINQHVKANYLASPPLVVAYALAGTTRLDLVNDPIGEDQQGNPVYLKDIWPSNRECDDLIRDILTPEMFRSRYSDVFTGPQSWQDIAVSKTKTYHWKSESTYVRNPPFFEAGQSVEIDNIEQARALLILGDSVTTDHISPAGSIAKDSAAGQYLIEQGVKPADFNSYGSRRGNHEVMMRGTFANIRIRNKVAPGTEGGWSKHQPDGTVMSVFDTAMKYQQEKTPLIVLAGREYGTGSSRDWAAKGTRLLGVKAVIAQSYERIHRSNLVGMGVLPLQFISETALADMNPDGTELFDIRGLDSQLVPSQDLELVVTRGDGSTKTYGLRSRIDTKEEAAYLLKGGILEYVLQNLSKK
ncbi:aconitate hydratase AcnA [Terasakiella sp.]|uniref:aconitate hydratase AcnA n=1 Tax=Terasakiella sp. TaxID=2034861 RepID=UPI003AA7EE59